MSIKPILFNTEMVQAILEGRKTQTRRAIKLKYGNTQLEMRTDKYGTRLVEAEIMTEDHKIKNPDGTTTIKLRAVEDRLPPYQRGDILWVRETWQYAFPLDGNDQPIEQEGRFFYYADNIMPFGFWVDPSTGVHKDHMPWRPSIHMPREAARIFLRVNDVRVERLHEMSEEDAIAEGFADSPAGTESPLERFTILWDKTVKRENFRKYGYHANPWVWVIEFERYDKSEGWGQGKV